MWAWKYVLKDEILDMLLAHKSLPCEDAKRIREKLSTQETWREAMAGGLLFSRETLDNIPDNELDPSILTAIGDSSVAHDIVMIWTWHRGKSVKVVANKSWLGALQSRGCGISGRSHLHQEVRREGEERVAHQL